MSETRHTPLPWAIAGPTAENDLEIFSPESKFWIARVQLGPMPGVANAAYIDKACNLYPELVAALAEARQVFRDHVAVTNFYCGVCDRHAPRDVDGVPEDIPHTDECTIGKIEGLLSRIRK